MVRIELTSDEYAEALTIGQKRQALYVARNRDAAKPDRGGSNEQRNVDGAVAEYAVAKHYGVLDDYLLHHAYSVEHWKIKSDVGRATHVRATRYTAGKLICHRYDPDGEPFILAIVDPEAPVVTLVGWAFGHHVKQPKNWRDFGAGFKHRPAFTLEQNALKSMDDFPKEYM